MDPREYPFASRSFESEDGRIHYVDEGEGPPLLFVHGTPSWSFEARHLIRGLSAERRCVAPDHLGFGLSDKPAGAPYRPADHARRLAALIERLGLRDFTLVVHDFGGPIGLSYAIAHPERVRAIALLNTWMWGTADHPEIPRVSRFVGSSLGRLLYLRLNFSPRVLLKYAMARPRRLSRAVHRHYLAPFARVEEREAPWVLGKELLGSSDWYAQLWSRREALRGKPVLIAWGMKDPAFRRPELRRWRELFPGADVLELADVGHFPQEEAPERLVPALLRLSAPGTAS